jgi:HEAT repeat protein
MLLSCAALCVLVSGSAFGAGGGGGGGGGTGGGKGDGKKGGAKKPAVAAPANPGSSTAPTAMFALTPELTQKLSSSDESQIRAALDDVRLAGKAAAPAVPAIVKLLQRGVSSGLAEAACDTLGDVQSQDATIALAPYARHREVKVRRAATKALSKTRGAEAVKALRVSLSDSDAVVRGLAATGLGSLKAKEAVPDLLDALDHKIAESASSVGQLCAPEECELFMGKLGRLPFDVMTGGFDQMIFRPEAEISDDNKVKVIGRLRELGTAESNKFLKDVQARWPAKWSKRVKQAIDQAVIATGGGS